MKRRTVGSRAASSGPVVAAVGAALLVTGCGAGQITQTDTQVAAINGTSVDAGSIAIRNAEVAYPETNGSEPAVYPKGSDAGTTIWLVNQSGKADELLSASTEAAADVTLEGSRTVPAYRTLVLGPGQSATGDEVSGDPTRGSLTLNGLTRDLRPGQMIDLTLTFRDAGAVTFELPITVPEEPRTSDSASSSHEGGGH
ncbi:copper chaperone PCu(A)C [Saccharomonospora sp. NB11]|uniref:copper chaperone PCu(A)C n=1 Tax=Saccharomonospora sp. NB11 TaxID=1642298 RepID=UPI0018D0CC43|nr:copper chaperone PCu(A)C [Saccharomonospora sp. NB11]